MDGIDYNNISDNLFKLIIEIHKKAINQDELLKCMPLPQSHIKVVFYLKHYGSSSVSHIGRDLNISKPNMTPIIDNLFQSSLVRRCEDPKDRRKIRIELTEKGHDFLHNQHQRIIDKLSSQISTLDIEDILTLERSVSTLHNIISKL